MLRDGKERLFPFVCPSIYEGGQNVTMDFFCEKNFICTSMVLHGSQENIFELFLT
jgi:hypothetical protein